MTHWQAIRKKYGSDTALGSSFDILEFEYAEEVNQFIKNETISKIVIVNDVHCTFISNTIVKDKNHKTKAEKVLQQLTLNSSFSFKQSEEDDPKRLLARLNIYRQADFAFIGNKITDGIIDLSGLIYNRKNSEFEKLEL